MSRAADIYPYRRILEKELEKLKNDINGKALLKYHTARVAEGLSPARLVKCISTLRLISRNLKKKFEDATKDDIVSLVAAIEQRGELSTWTKRDYKIILKKFYQWLRNCELGEFPPEVKWIRVNGRIGSKLMKKDLLTTEEIKLLVNATNNTRDKALILVLAESGRRIGEILTLRIQDVEFDGKGARILVDGKTGRDYSRLIASAPILATWLDTHPFRNDPKAPIWIGLNTRNYHKQLAYSAARAMLKDCAKRAGIKKRVWHHLFRYTRATEAAVKLNSARMCALLGWKQGSKMPSVYIHLAGEDIDDAQAIMNGVENIKEEKDTLELIVCPRCNGNNSPTSRFCNRCGLVLDLQKAMEIDETREKLDRLLDKLTEDPEKLEILLRLIENS